MAEADHPKWGFGLPPLNINPVESSFTKFFSTCDSTQMPILNGASTDMSWNATLAVPITHTRLPAWYRVAIQPQASTSFTRPIMKRVGLCARRSVVNTPKKTFVKPSPEPEVSEPESRRIRRRLDNYEPAQEKAQFEGRPSSQADVAAQLMEAKVVATNNFLISFYSKPLDGKKEARNGTLVKVTPVKRYAGSDVAKKTDPVGGNTTKVYLQLEPIMGKAIAKGMTEVDYAFASIAETSAIMNDIRRNPRRHVAAHGVPDLSDIADVTEPESPHMIRPPTLKAESRSPRKRIARLTSPIKNGFQRLTSSIVKLVPGSGPKAEPSPSKSDSTPSTPLKLSPTPTKQTFTPTGNSSPLSRSAHAATESVSVEYTPPRVFRVPSCTDSSSLAHTLSDVSSPSQQEASPAKFSRPVAPTPSRWNRREPETPQPFTPMPTRWTPSRNDSPINLTALIPPSTPQAPKCTFNTTTPTNAEFRFGEVSASFNSPSWMNPSIEASEPRRIQTINRARRRQSEPLLRQHFKSQARRRSSSPRKAVLQNDDVFSENTSITTPLPLARLTAPRANVPDNVTTVDEDVTMMTAELTSLVNEAQDKPKNAIEPTNLQTPTVAITPAQDTKIAPIPTTEHGVLNIDTRLNPDIFGAQGSSSPPAPVQKLAQIADDGCAGHANVVVKHENGRLYVRFKLPLDYAYMFPDSQGFDESRFTTSPSAISSSPRITFATRQPSSKSRPSLQDQSVLSPFAASQRSVQRLPSLLDKSALSPFASRQRSTMHRSSFKDQSGYSPFASRLPSLNGQPSPSVYNESTWSPSSMPSPGDQSVWSPFWPRAEHTPGGSADGDRTMVVDWPLDGEASTQKTPSKRQASMMSAVENTPSMMGRGLIQNTTPSVQTPAFETPNGPVSTALFANLTASAKPTSPLEPTPMIERAQATPSKSPVASTPTPTIATSVIASVTPTPARDTSLSGAKANGTPAVVPTLTTSFTPVNKTTPRIQVTAPPANTSATPENTTPAKTTPVANSPAPPPSARQETFDDSPGRDYMRDFIKRSRQATTTETGSPIALPAKRQPLVAKSPNSGSAQKKRKLEKDNDNSSPLKQQESTEKSKEPVAKRARRTAKTSKQKASPAKEIVHAIPTVPEITSEQTEEANNQEDELAHEGPATRRSTRLQTVASLGPKSSIPTAIKLNHRSGAGRAGGAILNSTVRSEQQELTAQTRLNTKKNKGAAEYPAQVLARVAESLQSDDSDNSSDAPSNSSKGRKSVVWNEPLEQVPEKPKKGRPAAKAKVTQGKTGIAKPKATAQSKRTAKFAENLGMVSNGTPARPTRMTRSRTRSQA